MNNETIKLCKVLSENSINFKIFEHEAVYTINDVKNANLNIPGIPTKNLFLRDKKKKAYFIFICPEDKIINLKKLSEILEVKNICFASEEELNKFLKLEMGDVGPFGIINDEEHKVIVVIDEELVDKKDINLSANSLINTITIDYVDLVKFVEYCGNKMKIVNCKY